MQKFKRIARRFPPYIWLANQYRAVRRLFIYPKTARVGVPDYDEYWEARAARTMGILSPFRRARAEALARVLPTGAKVLDLGVGDGAILQYVIEARQLEGYGVDISPKAVEFCRSQGLNVTLADINEPLTDQIDAHYDAIVMSEIIEHLPDPEHLLNTLRDRADRLIVTIPNTGYYLHRLRLLLGRFPLQWIVTPGEHLRFWTVWDFRWWARQMGFRIVHEEAYRGVPLLRRVWPNLFGEAMVYVLENARTNDDRTA